MRRSFLFLAAGLLASLALATSSRAGAVTLVTTDGSFNVSPGHTTDGITFTYTEGLPVDPSALNSLAGTTVTPLGWSENVALQQLTISFTAVTAGVLNFSFTSDDSHVNDIGAATSPMLLGITPFRGNHVANANFSVAAVSVPEPTSMGLLGIGIGGFFSYRRWFGSKKP